MFQGILGFVLGGLVVAVLLTTEPHLLGDVRVGLHDLRAGTNRLINGHDRDHDSYERRYGDREN